MLLCLKEAENLTWTSWAKVTMVMRATPGTWESSMECQSTSDTEPVMNDVGKYESRVSVKTVFSFFLFYIINGV